MPVQPRWRYEIVQRSASVILFPLYQPSAVNFGACFQVVRYGDRGFAYSISNPGFYDAMAGDRLLAPIMRDLGVRTLEGYVTPAHARLMAIAFRQQADVQITGEGEMQGHNMCWVVVRPIKQILE